MSGYCRSMASASWITTENVLLTSALSPQACSVVVETILRWACSNVASDLKTSSSTAASKCLCFSLTSADDRVQHQYTIMNNGFTNVLLRDSKHPEPPPGTKWKEVRHDNKVTWLVSWTENIQGSIKYIMLNPSSRIKVG